MIKFYKSITEYADTHKMCRQTASKYLKEWKLDIIEVPKGTKFIWIKIGAS